MQKLILAAGQGQRMRPLTENIPKCLVQYCGRPLLDYCIESLGGSPILIGGYKAEKLLAYGDVIVNQQYDTSGMVESLFCFAPKEDVIVSYSDIIYTPDVVQKLTVSIGEISVVVDDNYLELWQKRMTNPLEDLETLVIENDHITEIGNKPSSYEKIESQFTGLLKITLNAWAKLKDIYLAQNDKSLHTTKLLSLAIQKEMKIEAIRVNKRWMEFDTPSDLLITDYLF